MLTPLSEPLPADLQDGSMFKARIVSHPYFYVHVRPQLHDLPMAAPTQAQVFACSMLRHMAEELLCPALCCKAHWAGLAEFAKLQCKQW